MTSVDALGSHHLLRGAVIALASFGAVAPLRAELRQEPLMVLVRLDETIPTGWEDQAQRTARYAVQADARYRWLAPPQVSLEESRTALGCAAWDPRCVAAIGKTLSAKQVLYVEVVRPFQRRPVLTLFRVHVDSPDDTTSHSVELPDAEANGERVLEVYVRGVLGAGAPDLVLVDDGRHLRGDIAVAAVDQLSGTWVSVDGQRVGQVPLVLQHDLAPGSHALSFENAGYRPVDMDIMVVEGRPLSLTVKLKPGVAEDPVAGEARLEWISPLAWGGIGVGAAVLAAGGVLYALSLTTEQQLADAADVGEGQAVEAMSQVEYEAAIQRADLFYYSALGSLTAGALLAGSGAMLLLLSVDAAEE